MRLFPRFDWDAIYLRIQNFPLVNAKGIWVIIMDAATFAMVFALCWAGRTDSGTITIVGLWFGVLMGMHGFVYAGYSMKRRTSRDGNADEDTPDLIPPITATHAVVIQRGAP